MMQDFVNNKYDTNTYKKAYYQCNKAKLNRLSKRRRVLKRHPINIKIIDYEPNFSCVKLNTRRGILNEILITTFCIHLIYNLSTYDDFVDAFNDVCEDDSKKLILDSMDEALE